MGSPLGALCANMYMATVEERTFREYQKPKIYGRYIDDIFFTIKETDDARKLADALKRNSLLNFTTEHSQQKTLPFLDVLMKQQEGQFKTTVYVKATNAGRCLNARGECDDAIKAKQLSRQKSIKGRRKSAHFSPEMDERESKKLKRRFDFKDLPPGVWEDRE
ncbi:uncharacterized protein [Macrobrachium rosenbergii]|uniref:uncharacterized protein n=1 Tax=Macrobrachium rosenbergii TaxID=79674 RepID=UPI0034D5A52A